MAPNQKRAGIKGNKFLSSVIDKKQDKKSYGSLIKVFLGLSLVLVFYNLVFAESENYCHDKESWKEWDALVEKNPNDKEVHTLHALRIGLCVKVDRGGITLNQATEIFESAREAIVEKRKKDRKREGDKQKL